ncbi:tol-pal system protein YbgF [Candidatus Zixiibacteriota bacterium]
MATYKKNIITAIFIMAVMIIALFSNGCVTSRHIDELKAEIRDIKADNAQTRDMVSQMDSLITSSTESNNRLRNDVSMSNDQMQERIDQLLENYNELLVILQQINQKMSTKKVIIDSPGVQPEINQTQTTTTQTQTPSIDCGATYDESFIAVRRGEYVQAIEGFEKFLAECPQHESVENAHYWIGESMYSQEKYVEAIEKFQFLLNNYKSSVNLSRAMYQLARSQQELGKKAEAKTMYQKIIDDFPDSFEANQATDRLKDL